MVQPTYEAGTGIAVDDQGCAYVTGFTNSIDFPIDAPAPYETYAGGTYDAFVLKLNADGDALLKSTYLGGSNSDQALDIDLFKISGNQWAVYICGSTQSKNDFPNYFPNYSFTVSGAFTARLLSIDNFFSFDWSRIITRSSENNSGAKGIAVDGSGNAYVTGICWISGYGGLLCDQTDG